MNSQQKSSYNKKGYYLASIDLTEEEREDLIAYCKTLDYYTVFQHVGGAQDMKRLQASVTRCATTEQLFTTVECILNQACALWEIKEAVALRSEPNGPVQDIHRVMSISDVADAFRATRSIPVGAIVALMPGTKLRVYNGCFGDSGKVEQGRKRDVDIQVGECLVFRGDLAHCGLSYATTNYRIHFAVGIADTTWVANQTHPVQIKTFDCKCGSCFNTNSALRRHLRWCRQFGDPDQVKATRQRYDELDRAAEQVHCSLCLKSYSKRSSLRTHIRQSHQTATQDATPSKKPVLYSKSATRVDEPY